MKLKILSLATLLASLCLAAPSVAENPAHLRQLQETKKCPGCDLSGANLNGVNLTDADLRGANLIGASLSNANLSQALLMGANLIEANLSKANLSNADFKYANLVGANLVDAQMSGTDLSGANMVGVDLKNTSMTGVKLLGANLMGVMGLPLLPLCNATSAEAEAAGETNRGGSFEPPRGIGVPEGRESGATRGGNPDCIEVFGQRKDSESQTSPNISTPETPQMERTRGRGYQPPCGIGSPDRRQGAGTYQNCPPNRNQRQ